MTTHLPKRSARAAAATLTALAALAAPGAIDRAAAGSDSTAPPASDAGPTEVPDLSGVSLRVQTGSASPLAAVGNYMLDLLESWGAEVDRIEFTGSSSGTQAILAGQTDLATITVDELIINETAGVELSGFAAVRMAVDYALVVDDEIQSLEDLAGTQIAMSGPGGFDVILTRMALEQAGVPTDDIDFIQLGVSGDRATALLADRVDATMIFLSTWLEIQDEEGIHQLPGISESIGALPATLFAASPDFLEENPNVGVALACANLETFAWMNEGPDEWVQYVLDTVPDTEEASLLELYDLAIEADMFPTDPAVILAPGNLQALADNLFESGEIEAEVDTGEITLDHSFIDQAVEDGCGAG